METVYRVTQEGSLARDFGLRDQMRRAAVSIPSNIAEGFERFNRPEYHHFLVIAKGSCGELRTQVEIAYRVGHLPQDVFAAVTEQAEEVARILAGMRRSVSDKKG